MRRFLSIAGTCAAALLAAGCAGDVPTAPGPENGQPQPVKASKGLRVTPPQLAFAGLGDRSTLTASTPASGALVATVSSPACVSVSPRRVTRSPAKFTVTATAAGTCAVSITDGSGATVVVPVEVIALERGSLVTGLSHSCGLTTAGLAYCWGKNEFGQLGTTTNSGATTPNPAPLQVQGGLGFTNLAAGANHTCGLTATGIAYCWGLNMLGELGSSTNLGVATPNPAPVQVSTALAFVALASGSNHTCGLTSAGAAHCWGYNLWGQIGSEVNAGTVTPNPAPVEVAAGVAFTQLEAGDNHVCALAAGGDAYCWGRNNFGQLGTALNINTATPTPTPQLVGGNLALASLAAGGTHTCGLTSAGAAYCWGNNESGELGNALEFETGIGVPTPQAVDGDLAFTALTAGREHTCGVAAAGGAYCWGINFQGQLGSPTDFMQASRLPLPISGGLDFVAISAAQDHNCGVIRSGAAYCWGLNQYGQLGTATNSGTFTVTVTPQPVSGGLVFAQP